MYKQSVRTSCNTEIPRIFAKYKYGSKDSNHIHRQPDDPGFHQKRQNPYISHGQNSTKSRELEQADWKVRFCWVKAHVGTLGNELADRLIKEAATNADIAICYNKSPKSVVLGELEKTSVETWQSIWSCSFKVNATKEYFPTVTERLNMKISTNQHLTTMLTGHGNIKSYLHRFKIITSPVCPWGKNDQTTDQLLYECELFKTQRNGLRIAVSKSGDWPTSKTLISMHYKSFKIFVNSIPFDNLG